MCAVRHDIPGGLRYDVIDGVPPNVCSLWIPSRYLRFDGDHHCGDFDRALLLPGGERGLSLVVEILH